MWWKSLFIPTSMAWLTTSPSSALISSSIGTGATFSPPPDAQTLPIVVLQNKILKTCDEDFLHPATNITCVGRKNWLPWIWKSKNLWWEFPSSCHRHRRSHLRLADPGLPSAPTPVAKIKSIDSNFGISNQEASESQITSASTTSLVFSSSQRYPRNTFLPLVHISPTPLEMVSMGGGEWRIILLIRVEDCRLKVRIRSANTSLSHTRALHDKAKLLWNG